jgi:hypothetical protein
MTAPANVRASLVALLERGSLARSTCSGALLAKLEPLLASQVVVETRSGAGRRLVLRDPALLGEFIARHFPAVELPADAPRRVAGVAGFRDSKTYASDTPEWLVLRAWSDAVFACDGRPVPVGQATAQHGVFAFVLSSRKRYELWGPCALVENPAVLLAFESLRQREPLELVLYGGGRSSRRVLAWLAGQPAPAFRLIHLPDYDPVGLSEFVRLRTALGARVSLYLPDDLDTRFARFGNAELLRRPASQALLPRLRANPCPEVRAVLELMDRHHAGLEQEALLL